MVTVKRHTDIARIKEIKPPILIYGRRKTGKTFFAKEVFKDFSYFFVRRNRSIFSEEYEENITYKELLREIKSGKNIIVDEFHRLPEDFLDFLHIYSPENLVLITSTLHLAKELIGKRSPILGLFLEFKLDIISPIDIVVNLKPKDEKRFIEQCVFFREPILLRFYGLEISEIIKHFRLTVPSLVGEIFIEEDRKLTERYEGIMRAVAVGKVKVSEITDYLYSNKLIEKREEGLVRQYIKNLLEIGILKRYQDFLRGNYYYFLHSPMVSLYYYLDEKYGFSERDIPRDYILNAMPYYVEDFFRDFFSQLYNLRPYVVNLPNLQVDGIFVEFKKPKIVVEVKWKSRVKKEDIEKVEKKLEKFRDCRKILVVPREDALEKRTNLEVWDVKRVLVEAKRYVRSLTGPNFLSLS